MFFCGLSTGQAAYWHTDYGTAQAKAYGENRAVLLYFTGSDWCEVCTRLRTEVLSTPEFMRFADARLVLVEVDFPRWKQLNGAQKQANRALANKYMVGGYPRLILLNSKGEQIASMGYRAGGPANYIDAMEKQMGLTDKRATSSEPSESLPLFSGAPTGPAPKYKELTLKSISGTGAKKLALINNQTLASGESAKVRMGAGEVKVRCEEIREGSVIVTVDGKPERKELRLARRSP